MLYCGAAGAKVESVIDLKNAAEFDSEYDKVLGQWFMKSQMEALDRCVKENHTAAISPFDGFIEVDPRGLIIKYHVEVKNPFSLCLKSVLEGKQAPKPPEGVELNPFDWGGMEEV
jgi:hypothetical protein